MGSTTRTLKEVQTDFEKSFEAFKTLHANKNSLGAWPLQSKIQDLYSCLKQAETEQLDETKKEKTRAYLKLCIETLETVLQVKNLDTLSPALTALTAAQVPKNPKDLDLKPSTAAKINAGLLAIGMTLIATPITLFALGTGPLGFGILGIVSIFLAGHIKGTLPNEQTIKRGIGELSDALFADPPYPTNPPRRQ